MMVEQQAYIALIKLGFCVVNGKGEIPKRTIKPAFDPRTQEIPIGHLCLGHIEDFLEGYVRDELGEFMVIYSDDDTKMVTLEVVIEDDISYT